MRTINFIERDISSIRLTFAEDEVRIKCSKDVIDKYKDQLEIVVAKINECKINNCINISLRNDIRPERILSYNFPIFITLRTQSKLDKYIFEVNEHSCKLLRSESKLFSFSTSVNKIIKSKIKIELINNSSYNKRRWKILVNNKHRFGIRKLEENKYEVYSTIPSWKMNRFIISTINIEEFKEGLKNTKTYN
jgi:hypothetical protein